MPNILETFEFIKKIPFTRPLYAYKIYTKCKK